MKSYSLNYIKKVLDDFAYINDLPKVNESFFENIKDKDTKLSYLKQFKNEMLFNLNLKKNVILVSIELLERLI